MSLAIGEHPGTVITTRVENDPKGREVIRVDFAPDAEPDRIVVVRLNWFGGAKPITARQIAALGYKGRLEAIKEGNSALNGTHCMLAVKQGAPRQNGGFFEDYSLKPANNVVKTLSEDFDFSTVGQEPPAGSVPAGW